MKKLSLFITILVFVNIIIAQIDPKVKLSPELGSNTYGRIEEVILVDTSGYIVTANHRFNIGKDIGLYKYDKNFKLIKSIELFPDSSNYFDLKVMGYGNNINIVAVKEDIKGDWLHYYVHSFDKHLNIKQRKKINSLHFTKRGGRPNFIAKFSPDSSKIAFFFFYDDDDKEKEIEMNIVILDQQNNLLWTKAINNGHLQLFVDLLTIQINNNGDLFLLYKIFDNNRKKEVKKSGNDGREIPAYDYSIKKFTKDSSSKNISLGIGEYFIEPNDLSITSSDYVNFTGIIRNEDKWIDGVCKIKIDQIEANIISKDLIKFNANDYFNYESDKNSSSNQKYDAGLSNVFDFLKICYRKDNSAVIVLEKKYFGQTIQGFNFKRRTKVQTLNTEEIVVINIDPLNNVENIIILPKKQELQGGDANLGSVLIFLNDEGVNLIYNENESNYKMEYGKRVKSLSKIEDCVATNLFVSKNGKYIKRTKLFDKNDSESAFMPEFSKQISSNKIFISCFNYAFNFKSSEKRIGIIEY